jgi:ABC-type uncharacterized transport system YnjBCD permease subunit
MNTTKVTEWAERMDARGKRMREVGAKIQKEGLRMTLGVIMLIAFVFIIFFFYMSERETKEFTTPGGHKVVLRTYLTGREAGELKSVMFSALKMNMEDACPMSPAPSSWSRSARRSAIWSSR